MQTGLVSKGISRGLRAFTNKPMSGTGWAYRNGHNSIGDEQLFLPMQDQAAGEMPTGLDSGHHRQHFFDYTSRPIDQAQSLGRWRLLAEPFLVICRYIDGTVESLSPFCVSGVVMRMRDNDGFYASF